MLGKFCPDGPGGRDCTCCGQPPGIERKRKRRAVRRIENRRWRNDLTNMDA